MKQYWPVILSILGFLLFYWLLAPGIWDTYGRPTGFLFAGFYWAVAFGFISTYHHRYVDLVVRSVGRD
jgi:hypothetical protein